MLKEKMSTVVMISALQSLHSERIYDTRGPHQSTRIIFEVGEADIGSIRALEIPRADDIDVHATAQYVRGGGFAVFRMTLIGTESDLDLVASTHVVVAHIELSNAPAAELMYSVAASTTGAGFIDIVVPIPEQAVEGSSDIILRRLSIAGYDVTLKEAPIRVIVGFNHAIVPGGRVHAAVETGDMLALQEALESGCSTQETDWVSDRPCT
jgi:hypothetical protein